MNELALFAGAGGGILGSKLLNWRTVCAVEYNEYASSILMQRQNEGILSPFPIWDDIRTFRGWDWRHIVDVVTGGFPCQSYSTAARGRNNADDLWPEMCRVVYEAKPKFVFGENVSIKAIDKACDDCESMGYKTNAISFSAQDMGSDHIRKRYWFLAYADDKSKLLSGINAEMAMCEGIRSSVWETAPREPGMDDGMACRVDRFTAIGNGQIPIVAVNALIAMCRQ